MVKVYWIAFSIFIIDRITKIAATGIDNINILPFLNLIYVQNSGAGFGILQDGRFILIPITLAILYGMYKYKDMLLKEYPLATALILGGTFGNLFDRVVYGYVIDFIDVIIINYHWPTFNIADSALVIGVILIYMKSRKP